MPDADHADDRVDFYVLPDARPRGRQLLACRLAEKAYQQGYKAYIQTASREQAVLMDELLWTFKDIGFVPHVLAGDPAGDSAPVVLGHPPLEPPAGTQMLINLDAAVPSFVDRFSRVAELVDQSPDVKEQARLRFRTYRERGYSPQSHRL